MSVRERPYEPGNMIVISEGHLTPVLGPSGIVIGPCSGLVIRVEKVSPQAGGPHTNVTVLWTMIDKSVRIHPHAARALPSSTSWKE